MASAIMRLAELQTQAADERVARGKKKKPTQAETIIKIVTDNAELWHDMDGEAWATVSVGTHKEHHPIRSRSFRQWVERQFYRQEGKAPSNNAWQDARGTIEGMARWDGEKHRVFVRVAEYGDSYYIDLANDKWQAIKITGDGWEIVDDPPVRFRRAAGMLPLPIPKPGGTIDDLRPFTNVASDDDFRLIVSWLVKSLRPKGPYPTLILQGEQGTAKSTTARVLRRLVDPATVELNSGPRNERDLAIAANNAGVLALDNLSGVRPWLSDALARVATGGGLRTRRLYENDEEALFSFVKPVILNGIDDIATRQDLADRAIILHLPVIPEENRRTEQEFWTAWQAVEARVLGVLLDAVSVAMARVDTVKLSGKPRMADFAVWATAAEPAFGWPEGAFMRAYASNRKEAIEQGIEADVVAHAIRLFLDDNPDGWTGTTKELIPRLERYVNESTRDTRAWPTTPEAMSNRLRRVAPALRRVGVSIERPENRTSRGRPWIIKKENACNEPSQPAQPSLIGNKPHNHAISGSDSWSDGPSTSDSQLSQPSLVETPSQSGFPALSDGSDSSLHGFSFYDEAAATDEEEDGWEVFEI